MTVDRNEYLMLCRCGLQRILSVQYSIPDYVHISVECRHLLSRIFVANPAKVLHLISRTSSYAAEYLRLSDAPQERSLVLLKIFWRR